MKNFFIYGYDNEGKPITSENVPDRSIVRLTTGQIGIAFGGYLYLKTEIIPLHEVKIDKVWDYPALYESIDNVSRLIPPCFDASGVDWERIPVDTKVEVRIGGVWKPAFFAGYIGGKTYYFTHGRSSYTANETSGDYAVIDPIGKENIRLFKKGL